ncbi:hypothetical protein ACM6Q7_13770 [Peribacillus butanolivorans]
MLKTIHLLQPLKTAARRWKKIAAGGGSPLDAAKLMWIFYENPELPFDQIRLQMYCQHCVKKLALLPFQLLAEQAVMYLHSPLLRTMIRE